MFTNRFFAPAYFALRYFERGQALVVWTYNVVPVASATGALIAARVE